MKQNKGYTLIEMTLVVFLLGVILAISIPNFRYSLLTDGLKSTTRKIIGIVKEVRNEAIREQKTYLFNVDLEYNLLWVENADMDEGVKNYIEKQKSPQKEILRKLREIIVKTFPGIQEQMKWGAPNYEDKYYLVALKDHVNLGFSLKGLTQEEEKLFEGSGKTMKHIKLYSLNDIDEERITSLLNMVKSKE